MDDLISRAYAEMVIPSIYGSQITVQNRVKDVVRTEEQERQRGIVINRLEAIPENLDSWRESKGYLGYLTGDFLNLKV